MTRYSSAEDSAHAQGAAHLFVGNPREVGAALVDAKRVVALDVTDPALEMVVTYVLKHIPKLVAFERNKRLDDRLRDIVRGLLPDPAPSQNALREAGMEATAKKAVFEGTEWLTAAQVSELCGYSSVNPSAQPNKWKASKKIFSVSYEGRDLFPAYAFGRQGHESVRPLPVVHDVIGAFDGKEGGWSLAFWFEGLNSRLNGARPRDLLKSGKHNAEIVAAAAISSAGIQHG